MTVRIIVGEALEQLGLLPAGSAHCILSSPPYYGLRDYGTGDWEGGDPACKHDRVGTDRLPWANEVKGPNSTGKNGDTYAMRMKEAGGYCARCGALWIDRQIGLEQTPDEFVAKLVEVFREARRVLRNDGVAFINIGDSYAGSGRGGNPADSPHQKQATNRGSMSVDDYHSTGATAREAAVTKKAGERRVPLRAGFHEDAVAAGVTGRAWVPPPAGLKNKDLIGIPWMLAFALRADGWYLRQEIIWSKPNPMPESVEDRCTKSHEHVFLLSKSPRYFWNADAIAEPSIYAPGGSEVEREKGYYDGKWKEPKTGQRNDGSFKAIRETRNKRDVWTIATEPSSIPHYAMMPTELARTCILAGCPEDGTVLDPFGGAGTTGLVADRLQRDAILIELSPEHAETARQRLKGEMRLFAAMSRIDAA